MSGTMTTAWYKQNNRPSKYEHIELCERALGRALPDGAEVHHVDGTRSNRPGNLVLCESKAYHKLLHYRQRIVDAGGDPHSEKLCSTCGVQPLTAFNRQSASTSGYQTACRSCQSKNYREWRRKNRR